MDIEDTSSFDSQPADVRARRAAVLAGVGLVWAAFMASIGLALVALLVLVAAAAGAAWIFGLRLPHVDLHGFNARMRASTRVAAARALGATSGAAAGARRASNATGRGAGLGLRRAGSASRRLVTTGRQTAAGLAGTASLARRALPSGLAIPRLPSLPKSRRRADPRVDEALVSNSHGIALAKAGRHAEAIDAFDSALALLADTGDRHHEGQVLVNLGTVHRKVGGAEAARFCWSKALERLEPGTRESERTAELLNVR